MTKNRLVDALKPFAALGGPQGGLSLGDWSPIQKDVAGNNRSTPPMPTLEMAMREAESQTGGPVVIPLVTRDGK